MASVRRRIAVRLRRIEVQEEVRIFYACESGSRAWGFPSADSDYDVRFLYLHPRDWYLSIDVEKRPDVIERAPESVLDLNGWDLRKALGLFRKSNPPLLEWLQSPAVYRERFSIAAKLRALAPRYYSARACRFHYWHMAKGNYRDYLQGDPVWVKKYFYVLRPLLAVIWIERGLGMPPTRFTSLVARTVDDPALRREIRRLVAAKRAGRELRRGPRNEPISHFIDEQFRRLERPGTLVERTDAPLEPLNAVFREAVEEVWGG